MAKIRSVTYVGINTSEDPSKTEIHSVSESQFKKLQEEAVANKTPEPEIVRQQTFTIHEAESVNDILEVCPNEEVAVDLFNRGASLKQLTEIRELMESEDFEQVDGAYDLKEVIARKTERRKMSPMDKVLKSLGGLSDEDRKALVARLLGDQSSQAASN